MLTELAAGLWHIGRTPALRRMVLASATAFTAAGTIDVAIFALIDDGLHQPPTFLGLLGAVQGGGSVAAGFLVATLLRRWGEYGTASAGFLLNGVGLAAAATATVPGAVAGALAVGLGLPLVLVAEITLLQRRTAKELQGRVLAGSDAMLSIPFALAIGVAAGLVGILGFRPIYLADAAVFTIVGLVMLALRGHTRPTAHRKNAGLLLTQRHPNNSAPPEQLSADRHYPIGGEPEHGLRRRV
ncbi:MAG: MFS transporter [Actinobacteria bacterium]|nr:MFS transporter [Actinomycetota bacterium]